MCGCGNALLAFFPLAIELITTLELVIVLHAVRTARDRFAGKG